MAEARGFDWRLLRAVALVLLAVKLALLLLAHPFMDETYYFVWGRHPQLSYFDHPALVGWTQGLAGALFGWNVVGLRAMVLLTLVGDIWLLRLFALRTPDGERVRLFWTSLVLFLATPILFGLSSVALPDHLLLLFTLATVYCVARLRERPEQGRWLYLAALAVGGATLSKYTGVLLGVALLLYIVAAPALRPLLLRPQLYLAILLAASLQTPVLAWNAVHGLQSYGFVVSGRSRLAAGFDFGGLRGFALGAVGVLSPFFLWPLGRALAARRDGAGYGRIVFLVSTAVFLAASLYTNILVHWNAIAYVAVLPALAPHFRSRLLLAGQVLYGTLAILFAGLNYAAMPVTAIFGGGADQTSGWSYGWDEVADAVQRLAAGTRIGFVAATDYALASPLAFALNDPEVTSLSPRRDGYDDWFEPEAHRGEAALIVADPWRPVDPAVVAEFSSLTPAISVPVRRFGYPVGHYTIYIATGFAPASSQATN